MVLPKLRGFPKPPKWEEDSITQFLEFTKEQTYATFVQCPKEFSCLVKVDGLFREAIDCAQNTKHWFSYLFILKAHSAFLGAVKLIMGTQAQEAYMVMRGSLENPQTKREMRNKFQNKTIIDELKVDDKALGGPVEILYERVIDFGAHPNEKSLSTALKKTDLEHSTIFEISYLTSDPLVIAFGLKTVTQVGIACLKIAEKVLPERFKIIGLSDKIQAIAVVGCF